MSGCTPEQLAQLNQPIVGGTNDNGDPGVVLVNITTNLGGALCSGEVVSPHVVLTAGHCVDSIALAEGNGTVTSKSFSVFLGSNDKLGAINPAFNVPVAEAHAHPQFAYPAVLAGTGYDISVLTLSRAVDITPLPMNREPLTAANATRPVRVVVYGITTGLTDMGSMGPPGIKRQTTLMMTQTDFCQTGLTTCTGTDEVPYFNDQLISLGSSAHDTCSGDSGGPGFQINDNGVEVIIGTTSFGSLTCDDGYDQRLDPIVDFVDAAIAAAGDPPNVTPVSPPPAADMAVMSVMSSKGGCNVAGGGNGDLGLGLLVVLALGLLRRRSSRQLVGGVALAGLMIVGSGCTPEQIAQLNQDIVGGTNDSGDPGVVMINIHTTAGTSICTGEIVSPHVVLSAAHCVDKTLLGTSNPTFTIFLGDNFTSGIETANPKLNIPVTSYFENTAFSPTNLVGGNDSSALVTTEELTPAPLFINRDALTQQLNGAPAALRLVGYGITDGADGGNSAPAGIRRQVTTTMTHTQLCTTGLTTCTTTVDVDNFDDNLISLGTPTKGICHGDSGGPAFQLNKNGVEVIVGVTSFTIGDNSGQCTTSYSDRVDLLTNFIDPIIANAGDPPNVTPTTPPVVPDMAMATTGSSGKSGCNVVGGAPTGDFAVVLLLMMGLAFRRRRFQS